MPPTLDNNDPRSIAANVDTRVNPLAKIIDQAVAAQTALNAAKAEEEAEKVRNSLIEFNARTFDKAQSYTTVIIAGGYAGLFTIWSSAKDSLSSKGSVAIALCLTISLTVFVLYEVTGIGIRTYHFVRFKRGLVNAKSVEDYRVFLDTERKRDARAGLWFVPAYAISLVLTLVPAMIAAGLLVYNTMAKLIDLPRWPG